MFTAEQLLEEYMRVMENYLSQDKDPHNPDHVLFILQRAVYLLKELNAKLNSKRNNSQDALINKYEIASTVKVLCDNASKMFSAEPTIHVVACALALNCDTIIYRCRNQMILLEFFKRIAVANT